MTSGIDNFPPDNGKIVCGNECGQFVISIIRVTNDANLHVSQFHIQMIQKL